MTVLLPGKAVWWSLTEASVPREDELARRLAAVRARIERAAVAVGRDPQSVGLVAVSKHRPAGDLLEVLRLGQRDFGESRHQEAAVKVRAVQAGAAVAPSAVMPRWHFVGRLQSNKARQVAGYADVVHSVDRLELLDGLDRGAGERGRPLDVLVQVALDPHPQRGGAAPEDIGRLADAVAAREWLRLSGVMAVAAGDRPARPQFAVLAAISSALIREHPAAGEVSAGMSGDLEEAIAEGATLVRVGTALFGGRAPVLG